MSLGRLLLISPLHNEEEDIERVAAAVAAQTRPPDCWLMVDDGSDDRTPDLLRQLARQIPCARAEATPLGYTSSKRDRLAVAAAPRAFNWGLERVNWRAFDFIGKLDGDMELPPDYFERVLHEFERDPKLGIGGGVCVDSGSVGGREPKIPLQHVRGALKLYRRECFEAIGGMQECLGWDSIDETYARMRGFTTRSFPEIVCLHHRPWGTADGRLRGRLRYGRSAHVAGESPVWAALKSIKVGLAYGPPVVSGLAFLAGYLGARLKRVPRVDDPEFRRFARREARARMMAPLARLRPRPPAPNG